MQPDIYKIPPVTLLNQTDNSYVEVSAWEPWKSNTCRSSLTWAGL